MHTRDRILAAAQRLFHEPGYHATGISTILREADVNAGSLYNLYPGKEALLLAVLRRYTELLHPVVIAPVEARTKDPIARIFDLLEQYRQWLAPQEFRMGCPIGNLALEAADSSPEVRALVRENFDGWARAVQRWLDDAGDRLPPDLDRAGLAGFVLTTMEGGVMLSRAAGSPAPYEHAVEQLRAYFQLLQSSAAPRARTAAKIRPARKSAAAPARRARTGRKPR